MAREQFACRETEKLLETLDKAARISGVSRGQTFEDFLHMTVCALAGGTLEDQYLSVVAKHAAGEKGNRGCDLIAKMLAQLVTIMEATREDILGDLFQGAISYGENGLYYTPESLCELMAQITLGDSVEHGEGKTVCDPCCGSGRLLLAAAEKRPHWEFIGQDIDLRCVRMTAINLALWNRHGYVIWGNTLSREHRLVYQTGFNLCGFIRELNVAENFPAVQQVAAATHELLQQTVDTASGDNNPSVATPKRQLFLFDSP